MPWPLTAAPAPPTRPPHQEVLPVDFVNGDAGVPALVPRPCHLGLPAREPALWVANMVGRHGIRTREGIRTEGAVTLLGV
ncbi:hypothetical protein [Streptomyces sp. NPDC014685]|uniref:hypothetical protein n=1 Tax=Streptomyces sp. NPDC014685 TaxID=3364881 RepID=UPI00370223FB